MNFVHEERFQAQTLHGIGILTYLEVVSGVNAGNYAIRGVLGFWGVGFNAEFLRSWHLETQRGLMTENWYSNPSSFVYTFNVMAGPDLPPTF